MASFDVNNYSIKEKLPEWWKSDTFLTPINVYTQNLIVDMIGGLLSNLSVAQPFHVWKWLPEEYNWTHNYFSSDDYLGGRDAVIHPGYVTKAYVPNTKRNCHAIIKLIFTGNERQKHENINVTIKNGFQQIDFKNIANTSSIKILTETNQVLINGSMNREKFDGSFGKLQPVIKNSNYLDKENKHIDVTDENKETYLEITADKEVNFDLSIELIKPIYVTEQHIRLATVSAFPLEWVKLYGFFCHEFNDQQEYKFLWEKHYKKDDRIVYDKIAKQYDCERFYIQVKLYGIGSPMSFGFPQEEYPSDPAFILNEKLDKWGDILGLPRRQYRTDISDDEEKDTFPQYYKYPVEQDYWYEERLINEYRYNNDAQNALFLKDTDFNNVALLESISPYINDVWVFTETIEPEIDIERETQDILPCKIEVLNDFGVDWESPQSIKKKTFISKPIELQPQNSETMNDYFFKSKPLKLRFNLRDQEIPENIKITGIQLKINSETNIHSTALHLDKDKTRMLLNYNYTRKDETCFTKQEEIDIVTEIKEWKKGKQTFTIGYKNELFGLDEINRDQLFMKYDENENVINTGYLDFILAFENGHEYLPAKLLIDTITLKIFYEIYQDDFDIKMKLNKKRIVTSKGENKVRMQLTVQNTGEIPIKDKKIFIAVPPELEILNNKDEFLFDLDIGETFVIGDETSINQNGKVVNDPTDVIEIQVKDVSLTGKYDILVFCDDIVLKDQITVQKGFSL